VTRIRGQSLSESSETVTGGEDNSVASLFMAPDTETLALSLSITTLGLPDLAIRELLLIGEGMIAHSLLAVKCVQLFSEKP
jgi:hypothetical protein